MRIERGEWTVGADWQEAGERQALAAQESGPNVRSLTLTLNSLRRQTTLTSRRQIQARETLPPRSVCVSLCTLPSALCLAGMTRVLHGHLLPSHAWRQPDPTQRAALLGNDIYPYHSAHRPSSPNDYVTDSHDHMSTACFFLRTLVDLTCASNGPTRLFLLTLLGRQMPQNVRYPTSLP